MGFTPSDESFMREAMELSALGRGRVSPNPPVGCIIVRDETVVGRGYHQACGEAHAEVNAIADAGPDTNGATAYVTLMPCDHTGRTGPCTQALIRAGIQRVVVAVDDPNSASGDGRDTLARAGIDVAVGCLAEEAACGMRGFLMYCSSKRPFVRLKLAMTLDGKTATRTGESQWISGEESREHVQQMRQASDAIMVGAGTAQTDNPSLTVRDPKLPQPRRIILDTMARLRPDARAISSPGGETFIVVSHQARAESCSALEKAGARIIRVPTCPTKNTLDLSATLEAFASEGIREILCEGGDTLAGALVEQQLVDQIDVFIAPKLVGGNREIKHSPGIEHMKDALPVSDLSVTTIGQDLLLSGRIGNWPTDWLIR